MQEISRIRNPLALQRRMRLGGLVPEALVDRILTRARTMRASEIFDQRRRLATDIEDPPLRIEESLGFARVPTDAQSKVTLALRKACELLPDADELAARAREANKAFLLSVCRDRDFIDHPEILEFALSKFQLETAAHYFGSWPQISSIRLWWTPPNDGKRSSQRFHLDAEGPRQLKLFLHLDDVGPDAGPLHLLDAESTAELRRRSNFRAGRIEDAQLEALGLSERIHRCEAARGEMLYVDTSRCLHYGSRGNQEPRAVLMIQYTPADAPRAQAPSWLPESGQFHRDLNDRDILSLNHKPKGSNS